MFFFLYFSGFARFFDGFHSGFYPKRYPRDGYPASLIKFESFSDVY